MDNVTTLPVAAPASVENTQPGALSAADRAALLALVGMPDVSGMVVDLARYEAHDIVELRSALKERVDHVKAIFAEILREPEAIVAQSTEELRRRARAGGGHQVVSGKYRIAWPQLKRAGKPTKDIVELVKLRDHITPAEFAKAFSGTTQINAMLDLDTLSKIKALIPGAERIVKTNIDADGSVLNTLKRAYGEGSIVAKIIDAGYIPNGVVVDGELTIEPLLEPVNPTVVDEARVAGGTR